MNIQPLIEKFADAVEQHAIPGRPGAYCRNLGQEINPYGVADAANILYTIGRLERDPERRAAWIRELQAFQDPETGMFYEATHLPMHTTAHCIAALENFDAAPLYPLTELEKYRTPEGITDLLENLEWRGNPNPHGHVGSGAFASLFNTGHTDLAWQNSYFQWLEDHCDPDYGMSRAGMVNNPCPAPYHLFDWFHYLFNFSACHRPFPRVETLIDTCIRLFRENELPTTGFNARFGFWEIDWIYCVNRSTRQTKYRFDECQEVLHEEKDRLLGLLMNCKDFTTLKFGDDLHMIFGTLCAVAELQIALPGELISETPLRNILDRRPFI